MNPHRKSPCRTVCGLLYLPFSSRGKADNRCYPFESNRGGEREYTVPYQRDSPCIASTEVSPEIINEFSRIIQPRSIDTFSQKGTRFNDTATWNPDIMPHHKKCFENSTTLTNPSMTGFDNSIICPTKQDTSFEVSLFFMSQPPTERTARAYLCRQCHLPDHYKLVGSEEYHAIKYQIIGIEPYP